MIVRGNRVLPHCLPGAHPGGTGLNLIKKTRACHLYQAEGLDRTTGPDPGLDPNQDLTPEEVLDQDQLLNHRDLEVGHGPVLTPGSKRLFPILHEIFQRG